MAGCTIFARLDGQLVVGWLSPLSFPSSIVISFSFSALLHRKTHKDQNMNKRSAQFTWSNGSVNDKIKFCKLRVKFFESQSSPYRYIIGEGFPTPPRPPAPLKSKCPMECLGVASFCTDFGNLMHLPESWRHL